MTIKGAPTEFAIWQSLPSLHPLASLPRFLGGLFQTRLYHLRPVGVHPCRRAFAGMTMGGPKWIYCHPDNSLAVPDKFLTLASAVEKSELCQVTENEVEPRVPPLCKVPVLEALARGEACPGARVASKPGIALRFPKRIVAVFFDELVQTFVISCYVSLNKQVV